MNVEAKVLGKIKYEFSAVTWQHQAPGGWHFVSMPVKMSKEIRTHLKWQEEGWGRLKARAVVGGTEWDTAIWYDTKHHTYILPLKNEVRKKEKISLGASISVIVLV